MRARCHRTRRLPHQRGARGERGERGSIGPRGEPAPSITGWRVDCVAYAAVPLLSDGAEGPPLGGRFHLSLRAYFPIGRIQDGMIAKPLPWREFDLSDERRRRLVVQECN
jgi:hypothetical protein